MNSHEFSCAPSWPYNIHHPNIMYKTSLKNIKTMTDSSWPVNWKPYFEINCTQRGWMWEEAYVKFLSTGQWSLGKLQNTMSVWWRRQKTNMLWSVHILEMGIGRRKILGIQGKKGKGCLGLASTLSSLYPGNYIFLCFS